MACKDFVRSLKRNIVDLRTELKPLESREIQWAQRPRGGLWVDTTLNQIRGLKEMIATLEAVVSQFEGGEKKQTTKRREAASVREALHLTEV